MNFKSMNFVKEFILSIFAYSNVPILLYQEFRRIVSLIKQKRIHGEDPEVLLSSVRTWAHILDKGLQAENWEKGHGETHYVQLRKKIEKMSGSFLITDPSYEWALQKMKAYEDAQKTGENSFYVPGEVAPTISKADLFHLIQNRRSIRKFENLSIPIEILEELATVVSWSPTSCNRQPTKLFVTQNPVKVSKCLQQCAGATCLSEITPCFISVCADTRFYMLKDRNLPYIDTSLGLQNLLLMAHVQGIAGTILNWCHHTPEEDRVIRGLLDIPQYYSIIMNLIIGYSKGSAPTPGRKGKSLAYHITY